MQPIAPQRSGRFSINVIAQRALFVVIGVALAFGSVATSDAACQGTPISSCPATCSSASCYLANNVNCANGSAITLTGGANFDVCGNVITCTSATCFNTAILMTANSSKVWSSVHGPTSTDVPAVRGPFLTGINCALKSSSQVIGIQFDGLVGTSILDCAKVENNVILNAGGNAYAIASDGVSNSDTIVDNYIDAPAGVVFTGSEDITIARNLFAGTAPGAGYFGIDLNSAGAGVTITSNVFMSTTVDPVTTASGTTSGFTFDENFCNPEASTCGACRAAGFCEAPTSNFAMP